MRKYLGAVAATLFLVASAAGITHAQYQDQGNAQLQSAPDQTQNQNQDQSQVQPAVARVSLINGDVSIQRGDSTDWIAATINTPLEAGDRVSTGNGGRAEIQLDYADVIRLDENSTIKITDLTSSHIQVQVGQGLVNYSVFQNAQADSEIDTPNSAVHPLREGDYRIQVDGDSESQAIVRSGQAEVSEPQGSTRVDAGQLVTVQGTNNPQYQTMDAPRLDSFDKWNESRDRAILDAQSWQHTDHYYTGAQDLDAYGHWEYVPDYGQVWVPAQNSGWAPYRDGQWVWEPYYGWTWESYEPWGWAPYHYGRWFVYGGDWAWWPGPIGVYGGWGGYDPMWSPAYVSFFGWGGGGGYGYGFGFGDIGWLPCGPGDFYNPWWGYGVTQVNFVSFADRGDGFRRGIGDRNFGRSIGPLYRGRNGFSNISRVENDARIRDGISSVRGNEFGHGDVRFQRGIGSAQLRQASFMTGRLPVVPTQQSLGRLQRNVPPVIARTASLNNRKFFSQSKPSFTPRPFSQQQQRARQIIANSRMPGGTMNNRGNSAMNGSRLPATPALQRRIGNAQPVRSFPGGNSRSVRGAPTTQNDRFGTPARPQSGVRPGWHSFGQAGGPATRNPAQNRGSMRGQAMPAQQRPNTFSRPSAAPAAQRPGWHSFTRANGGNRGNTGFHQPSAPARSRPFASSPQQRQGGWHPFTPSSSRPNNSRPSLNMRQPVVSRRPSYYGGGPRRTFGGSAYNRPSGAYSPRTFGGGGRTYGRPSGGYSPRTFGGGGRTYGRPSGGYSPRTFGGGGRTYGRPSGGYSPRTFGGGGGRPSGGYSPRSFGGGGGRPSGGYSPRSFGGGRPSGGYSPRSFGGGGGRPSGGGYHGGGGGRPSAPHPSGGHPRR